MMMMMIEAMQTQQTQQTPRIQPSHHRLYLHGCHGLNA